MALSLEVPVFIDTSMGTHMAMAVSPEIKVGDFKREFERAHFNCFPKLGEIKVYGLMVKRKSCFYHLPKSVPIRYVFQGVQGIWFLQVEASASVDSDRPSLSKCVAAEVRDCVSNDISATEAMEPQNYIASTGKDNMKRKGKKRRLKRFYSLRAVVGGLLTPYLSKTKNKKKKRVKKNHFLECRINGIERGCLGRNEENPGFTAQKGFGFLACRNVSEPKEECNTCPLVEASNESSSEVMSVTGIIKRYFSNFNEVSRFGSPSSSDVTSRAIESQGEEQLKAKTDENCSSIRVGAMALSAAKTTPKTFPFPLLIDTSHGILKDKLKSTEVGKHLVMASYKLGISASKRRPAIALCRYKDRKLLASNSCVRSLVFQLSDEEN